MVFCVCAPFYVSTPCGDVKKQMYFVMMYVNV